MCLFELAAVVRNTNLDGETTVIVFNKGKPVYASTFENCDLRVMWEMQINPFKDNIYFLKDAIVIFKNYIEGIKNGGAFYVEI